MMRYRELKEAPIGNMEVHGMDEPGTFPEVDRRLLSNPKHLEKARYQFRNVPFIFNMYFVNQKNMQYVNNQGTDSKGNLKQEFNKKWEADLKDIAGVSYPEMVQQRFGITVPANPQAISVVYASNANVVNSIPMTPWIMAHRFGHALTDNRLSMPGRLLKAVENLKDVVDSILRDDEDLLDGPVGFRDFMTMRSAREGHYNDEWVEEAIAQYLITGSVKLSRKIDYSPEYEGTMRDWVNQVDGWETSANADIENILHHCRGLIFIAV